ncbi:hypothetical protein BJV77DRAFT_1066788 [Russula vinacea]|nr:hypothetical protein BJV77DRAFT_1066788 [Russula vinacea]
MVPSPPQETEITRPMPVQSQPSMAKPPAPTSPPFRTRSQPSSNPEMTHYSGMSSQDPNLGSKAESLPQPPPPSPQNLRIRTQLPTMSYPSRVSLTSTVMQVLTDQPGFMILVVGKRGSGKSSLVDAAFGVDMSAAINFVFHPDDNHHLIIHESAGLEPGDIQGLRAIQDFISDRTDSSRSARERLHAVWICVPSSDAISGNVGESVEEILSMRRDRVPVVVAFIKSDLGFPQISGPDGVNSQFQDRATFRAYVQFDQLCRLLFRWEPEDVPAELISVMPQYGALINDLIVMTDRFVMGRRASTPSARSSSKGTNFRTASTPLAWSVALRASRDITIQASIEIGRSRYWRNLRSSPDFASQPLKSCLNSIHIDIVKILVKIWNLHYRNSVSSHQLPAVLTAQPHQYLSSNRFKINMSQVVKDPAVSADGASQR